MECKLENITVHYEAFGEGKPFLMLHGGLGDHRLWSLALEALFEAADEDAATGGPDVLRGIYPNVAVVDPDGFRTVEDADIRAIFDRALDDLRTRYGGDVR